MQSFRCHIFLLLFCILAITACVKEPIRQEDLYAEQVNVKFQLALSLNGESGSQTRTDKLPGKDPEENRITSLTMFIVDLDASSKLVWETAKYVVFPIASNIDLSDPQNNPWEANVKTTLGRKHIYVGANMTSAQRASFCTNKGIYTSSGTTYKEVIGDFVSNRGIVMFGQLMGEYSPNVYTEPVFDISGPSSEDSPIVSGLELNRVVSKVALTYTPYSDPAKAGFVKLSDGIDGFIRAANVHFMLNNTSKSIDFIEGLDNEEYSDANHYYEMTTYLEYNDPNNNTSNPLMYAYIKDPVENFMIYMPEEVLPGIGNIGYSTPKIRFPFYYGSLDNTNNEPDTYCNDVLEEYKGTSNGGKHWHYNSSLYCLESTVSTTAFEPSGYIRQMRNGINTRVVVAAKYTPGKIRHCSSGSSVDTEITLDADAGTAEDQMDDMTTGGVGDEWKNDPFGPGTFYAVVKEVVTGGTTTKMYTYYTFAAKNYRKNLNTDHLDYIPENEFILYQRGYGYYATLISQPTVNVEADKNYNLYRNHYYILNTQFFTPPGAVYPQDIYILVNSVTTKWVSGKSTCVTVE